MIERLESTDEAASFRRHRHDVLNELQLIRAYLQMGQSERALGVVDRTAQWLQSLTRWHVNASEIGESVMWVAATCPAICLNGLTEKGIPSSELLSELKVWLHAANEMLCQLGERLHIFIRLSAEECVIRVVEQHYLQSGTEWIRMYPQLTFVGPLSESDEK